jgi:hypothetical protein
MINVTLKGSREKGNPNCSRDAIFTENGPAHLMGFEDTDGATLDRRADRSVS